MRKSRTLNLGTGSFVLLGFAALFFLTTQTTSRGLTWFGPPHYELIAKFDNIGDLKVGAPVSMSGVEIGRVDKIDFDSNEYKAVVSLRLNCALQQDSDRQRRQHLYAGVAGRQIHRTHGGRRRYLSQGQGSHRLYAIRVRAGKSDRPGPGKLHQVQGG